MTCSLKNNDFHALSMTRISIADTFILLIFGAKLLRNCSPGCLKISTLTNENTYERRRTPVRATTRSLTMVRRTRAYITVCLFGGCLAWLHSSSLGL